MLSQFGSCLDRCCYCCCCSFFAVLVRYVAKPTDMYRLRCNCLLDLFVCFSVCVCCVWLNETRIALGMGVGSWKCRVRQQRPMAASKEWSVFLLYRCLSGATKRAKRVNLSCLKLLAMNCNMKTVRRLTRNIYTWRHAWWQICLPWTMFDTPLHIPSDITHKHVRKPFDALR